MSASYTSNILAALLRKNHFPLEASKKGDRVQSRLKFNDYFLSVYYVPDTGLATQQGHILSEATRKTKTTVGPASLLKLAIATGTPWDSQPPCLCHTGLAGRQCSRGKAAKLRNRRWVWRKGKSWS